MQSKVEAAFARDVPDEKQQEDILLLISECIWDNESRGACALMNREMLNAANYRGNGIITIGEEEFTFIASCGDWNGFDLESWNDDRLYEPLPVTAWALQPNGEVVSSHIAAGLGQQLIMKWNAFLDRKDDNGKPLRDIPKDYAYDRMFAPGGKTESHYRDRAAKWKFQIVSQETADKTRARLMTATEAIPFLSEEQLHG